MLLGVLDVALFVQLQLVDVLAGQPHNAVCVLVQHSGGLQQLPELCFLGCVGVLLGLLVLVVGQRLFGGFFFSLCALGCFFRLFRTLDRFVLFIHKPIYDFMVKGLKLIHFVLDGKLLVFQNRADAFVVKCHW